MLPGVNKMKDWHIQNWDKEFGWDAHGSCGGNRLVHHCITDYVLNGEGGNWDWHVCRWTPIWGWNCPMCGDRAPEEIAFLADLADCMRYHKSDNVR